MIESVKDKNGKDLYIISTWESNDSHPWNMIASLDECQKRYNSLTQEKDDESWFVKKVKEDASSYRKMCSLVVNRKGWGFDYMRVVTLEPAHYHC